MESLLRIAAAGAMAGALAGLAGLALPRGAGLSDLRIWIPAGILAALVFEGIARVGSALSGGIAAVYAPALRHRPPPLPGILIGALLLAAAIVPGLLELRSRPGFARLPRPDAILAALGLGAILASAILFRVLRTAPEGGLRRGVLLLVPALAATVVLHRLPLAVLPRLHLGAAFGLLAALGVPLRCLFSRASPRRAALGLGIASILAVAGLLVPSGTRASSGPGILRALDSLSTATVEESGRSLFPLHRGFGRVRGGHGTDLDRLVPSRRDLNVLWITVCTFRRDRAGFTGGTRGLTPGLDALAADAAVFRRAYTTFPTSAHAIDTMFSGRYAFQSRRHRRERGLDPGPPDPWLPETLRDAGRDTAALTALHAALLQGDFAEHLRGFDTQNPYPHLAAPTCETIVDAFGRFLAERPGTAPFFVWMHLMDCHAPYEPDPAGAATGGSDEERYDGEVRRVDRAIRRAAAMLADRELRDRTLLVVHGDHGEEFEEHGGRYHYSSVYEEQAGVPLLILVPGLDPQVSDLPVDLADLAPTVLDVLDAPPLPGGAGDSLAPALLGRPMESWAFSEVSYAHLPSATRRMIVDGAGWKLILRPGEGEREVYDLAADPGERRNIAGLRSPEESRLLDVLLALTGTPPAAPDMARVLPAGPEEDPREAQSAVLAAARAVLEDPRAGAAERAGAIATLAARGTAEDRRGVLRWTAAAEPALREAALEALSDAGAGEILATAVPLLRDPAGGVRMAAVRALARAGAAAAEHLRVEADIPAGEQILRAGVLLTLGSDSGYRDLLGRLRSFGAADRLRVLAGLHEAGDPAMTDALEAEILSDPADLESRLVALHALKVSRRGLVVAGALRCLDVSGLSAALRLAMVEALSDEPGAALPFLLRLAGDPAPEVRHRAVSVASRVLPLSRIAEVSAALDLLTLRGGVEASAAAAAAERQALEVLEAAEIPAPGGVGAHRRGAQDVRTVEAPRLSPSALAGVVPVLLRARLVAAPGSYRLVTGVFPGPDAAGRIASRPVDVLVGDSEQTDIGLPVTDQDLPASAEIRIGVAGGSHDVDWLRGGFPLRELREAGR